MTTSSKTIWCRLNVLALLAASLAVAGCGGSTGSVTGKVTYKGKTLTSGKVTFVSETNSAFAPIQPDGTYSIPKVPTGKVVITVETPKAHQTMAMDPSKMGGGPSGPVEPPKNPEVEAPVRYADPKTSPLNYEVKSGTQTYDIVLE